MSNSYRIRTDVGVDKSIKILLDQDFEYLEILSLKILQSQIYTRQCSDYGVVVGRVTANNGYGLPNCKVSVFIPLSDEDEGNQIISDLYPYKSLSQLNEAGYRYNLLPKTASYSAHIPTGSFFDIDEVLTNPSAIEVFDKYYKYTARTNDSGDYMIFGVPVGSQTIHIDIDLSDIGEFSLSPQDLIRMGVATEQQVAGTEFRSSANLNELPQIVSINRTIEIEPLWGQPEICSLGITRTDFDVTEEANINIQPTAIFMGSIISSNDKEYLRADCRPRIKQGELCSLIAGPGEILAIRQTIQQDSQGRPILETYELEGGGQVIDDNGTWLIDVPMNLDYIVTNEFGERIISDDPSKGIPTKGKYRFKIKWNQSPSLSESIKRGYFLVPNVREYGWNGPIDPLQNPSATPTNELLAMKSYSFSLDWDDYADYQTAVSCEDTFYLMQYNKVYSVSQLIDQYRRGTFPNSIISIKNILDDSCESENNKFPTNDAAFRWDFLYLLYTFLMVFLKPFLLCFIVVLHILFFLYDTLVFLFYFLFGLMVALAAFFTFAAVTFGILLNFPLVAVCILLVAATIIFAVFLFKAAEDLQENRPKPLALPLLLYDRCEFCDCDNDFEISDPPNPGFLINISGINIANTNGNYYGDLTTTNPLVNSLNQIFVGAADIPANPPCSIRVPIMVSAKDSNNQDIYLFSSSLTLAERINLFNSKNKFFEQSSENPGGGVNQMKVFIEPILNGNNPNKFHWDNLTVILCDQNSLQNIQTGQLLSFNNPLLSKDINMTGGTLNVYNNNAITGRSANNTTITITSLVPSGNNISNYSTTTTYNIPTPNPSDTAYHKFPTDIEYFQVLTAMTISQFSGNVNTTATYQPNNLWDRFLNNTMLINVIKNVPLHEAIVGTSAPYNLPNNPLQGLDNYQNLVVVFLIRGVDPYSSRVNIKYEIGRFFGFRQHSAVTINGLYKLNIPLQGKWINTPNTQTRPTKCLKHNQIIQNTSTDLYGRYELFYPSFNYIPSSFTQYNTDLHNYYIDLDATTTPQPSTCSTTLDLYTRTTNSLNNTIQPLRIYPLNTPTPTLDNCTGTTTSGPSSSFGNFPRTNNNSAENAFAGEFFISCQYPRLPQPGNPYFALRPTFFGLTNVRGYFVNERVEGSSIMGMSAKIGIPNLTTNFSPTTTCTYFSTRYDLTNLLTLQPNSPNQVGRFVMRSDRLPTSTIASNRESYALQNNLGLGIYVYEDDGYILSSSTSNFGSTSSGVNNDPLPQNFTAELVESLRNCSDTRNLFCYDFDFATNSYVVNSGNCQKFNGRFIFENGCYRLATQTFISLPADFISIYEWSSRLSINFGACRNVWSHLFTNNWINGVLYAFSFRNDRLFDNLNRPFSEYCTDVIYLNPQTNNFYYRSSPWDGSRFVGKPAPSSSTNQFNLLYPTTLIDLGPRTDYIQELVYSDDFDGYVVNRLSPTTFGNVLDIFNIYVFSRLANRSFINLATSVIGLNIFDYFSRARLTVDADYAQMISISSELGVTDFEPENYPDNPNTKNPIFFNTPEFEDVVFGIFFSSDSQTRDYISPRRTIINPTVSPTNLCGFSNINVFSQRIPMYQWIIRQNGEPFGLQTSFYRDSIFGSQRNDWYTIPFGGTFFNFRYQSLDRTNNNSRYFKPNPSPFPNTNQNYVRDMRGFIHSSYVDLNLPLPQRYQYNYGIANNGAISNAHLSNPPDRVFTVGAPQYFYFGLKKGKSAFDRFSRKWINFEVVTD